MLRSLRGEDLHDHIGWVDGRSHCAQFRLQAVPQREHHIGIDVLGGIEGLSRGIVTGRAGIVVDAVIGLIAGVGYVIDDLFEQQLQFRIGRLGDLVEEEPRAAAPRIHDRRVNGSGGECRIRREQDCDCNEYPGKGPSSGGHGVLLSCVVKATSKTRL